eukprot:scaffold25543_cov55-Attheya_sp.AAC.5
MIERKHLFLLVICFISSSSHDGFVHGFAGCSSSSSRALFGSFQKEQLTTLGLSLSKNSLCLSGDKRILRSWEWSQSISKLRMMDQDERLDMSFSGDDDDNDASSIILPDAYHIPERDEFDLSEYAPSRTEFWLDLRGTAISPGSALSLLADDFSDDPILDSIPVDRILISQDGIGRALQSSLLTSSSTSRSNSNIDLIYEGNEDGMLRSVSDETILYGKTIFLGEDTSKMDPIPALDAVSMGGWVILDPKAIRDEEDRLSAVSSLINFVSGAKISSTGAGVLLLGGGTSLDAGDVEETMVTMDAEAFLGGGELGGLALCCRTDSEIMKSAEYIQSMLFGGSITSTESGILLQQKLSDDGSDSKQPSLNAAVLLPLEPHLWKTAAYVFSDYSE